MVGRYLPKHLASCCLLDMLEPRPRIWAILSLRNLPMARMLACGMLILGVLILFSIVRSTLIFWARYVFMNLQMAWPIWLKELDALSRNRHSRCSWRSWLVTSRLL